MISNTPLQNFIKNFIKDLTELIQVLTNEMKSNHESGVPWIILSTRNGIIAQNNINSSKIEVTPNLT